MSTSEKIPVASLAFVLTVVLAAFLLFLGVRGMLAPVGAAHGFGIDLVDARDAFYLHVKADRDLCLGASLLALALYRRATPIALFVGATLVAPVFDAVLVMTEPRGSVAYALAVHGSAVVYGAVLVALLLRRTNARGEAQLDSAAPSPVPSLS